MAEILIIDDDTLLCQMLTRKLGKMGHAARSAHTAAEGEAAAAQGSPAVIFLDVMLPDGDGLELLPRLKGLPQSPEVIIFTARGTGDGAEMAIRTGAWDYITKPTSLSGMILPLTRALEFREKRLSFKSPRTLKRKGIVGQSPQLEQCLEQVADAAGSEANVLVRGETGTGKEMIALAIHRNSRRAKAPFVTVDCAALPETLAASQLFGHARGAFTGADSNKAGLLVRADGGTVFLDEVGELPLEVQKVFLRGLQEKRFLPLGARTAVKSDFRTLAATNRDLAAMVAEGTFREDLLFRLRAFNILLPPLRDRTGDIQELVAHYLAEICTRQGLPPKGTSGSFIQALCSYRWPGNIRELINTMERSIAASGEAPTLYPQHLPIYMRVEIAKSSLAPLPPEPKETSEGSVGASAEGAGCGAMNGPAAAPGEGTGEGTGGKALDGGGRGGVGGEAGPSGRTEPGPPLSLHEVREATNRNYLIRLLAYTDGNIKDSCRISGLSRSRLYALMKKYGLTSRA